MHCVHFWMTVQSSDVSGINIIPHDVQTEHIWTFLPLKKRIHITEWSRSYQALYNNTYPNQHRVLSAFYSMFQFVSKLKRPIRISKTLPRFSRKMSEQWPYIYDGRDRDLILFWAEKIFVEIAEVSTFTEATIMCDTFMQRMIVRLPFGITRHDPLDLMHEMTRRYRVNTFLSTGSIRTIFQLGLQVMNETEGESTLKP